MAISDPIARVMAPVYEGGLVIGGSHYQNISGGAIFMDEALALEMLALPTDQEDFMAVEVMAVGFTSNGDQSRAFDLDG